MANSIATAYGIRDEGGSLKKASNSFNKLQRDTIYFALIFAILVILIVYVGI